jgi:di- and tripeptidase
MQKYSTVQYGKYQDTTSFSQKYHCVNRWKAHEGRILASAVTNYNDQQLYITGANDNSVSVWNITGCNSGTYDKPQLADNQLIKSLHEFVSFQTISARPHHAEDCRRGASFLRALFKKYGAHTEMLNTDNHYNPIVYAKFKGTSTTSGNRKKILFYGHCRYCFARLTFPY